MTNGEEIAFLYDVYYKVIRQSMSVTRDFIHLKIHITQHNKLCINFIS